MNPSRAQLRMLHVLTRGTLVFKNWPFPKIEVRDQKSEVSGNGVDEAWQFHQVTARVIVERRWAELRKFDAHRGEYGLTVEGLALASELCNCRKRRITLRSRGIALRDRKVNFFEEETEELAGRLLCKNCARRVRCVSRKTDPHGATHWHGRWGPVCDEHPVKIKQQSAGADGR